MVERLLCMHEAPGSIPGISNLLLSTHSAVFLHVEETKSFFALWIFLSNLKFKQYSAEKIYLASTAKVPSE